MYHIDLMWLDVMLFTITNFSVSFRCLFSYRLLLCLLIFPFYNFYHKWTIFERWHMMSISSECCVFYLFRLPWLQATTTLYMPFGIHRRTNIGCVRWLRSSYWWLAHVSYTHSICDVCRAFVALCCFVTSKRQIAFDHYLSNCLMTLKCH